MTWRIVYVNLNKNHFSNIEERKIVKETTKGK